MSKENALIICDYIATVKRDINLSTSYRRTTIQILAELAKFFYSSTTNSKNFKEMTREDIILYLDSLRRPEVSDGPLN